ncbi:hypothetical protein [Kitasatospora sp. MBT63]|uniref:hypothetical protein n=1 Tax=Kitasatospora sp. MBT63 TaxID=1444768 RepID=UPI00068F2ACD|nr:hypothetical protein [Kitasatospora sp. MBT63]
MYEVEYRVDCESCGGDALCTAGASPAGGQVEWSYDVSCAVCGPGTIACGSGPVPADLRARLLARHGPVHLRLDDPSAGAVTVMKVLRAELGGSPAAAKATLGLIRAGGYAGVRAEVEVLALRLRAAGAGAGVTEGPRPPG